MTDTVIELLPTIILQAPSLAGLIYALVVVSQHNKRLLSLIEKLCRECPDATSDIDLYERLANAARTPSEPFSGIRDDM